jgi:hypothetical protein
MNCSWADLLTSAGWEYARPDSPNTLAFVCAARVGLSVEGWCVGLNPDLSHLDLCKALTKEPDWIAHRPQWLKLGWPRQEAKTKSDLELFGLIHAKAYLACGSRIPDGPANEMAGALAEMFPEVTGKPQEDALLYQSWIVSVTVDLCGRAGCGWRGAREGKPLPRAHERIGSKSAFDILLLNQMRIFIQREIETLTT